MSERHAVLKLFAKTFHANPFIELSMEIMVPVGVDTNMHGGRKSKKTSSTHLSSIALSLSSSI